MDEPTRVFLVRHGETPHNRDGIIQGQRDIDLSANGIEQARLVAKHLASEPITAIYASNLTRSRRTASIIGTPHDMIPLIEPGLAEQSMGDWEGRSTESLFSMLTDEGLSRTDWVPANGEPWPEFRTRVLEAIERIVRAHSAETVVVVGHMEVNRVILSEILDEAPPQSELGQANACCNELTFAHSSGWNVQSINETTHLDDSD